MTANELLKKSQQYYVNSGHGVNSTINYKHNSGVLVESLNVFQNENEFDKKKSDSQYATTTLTNVFLDEEPTQNDVFNFVGDNKVWRVKQWKKQDATGYSIEATHARYKAQ